MRERETEAVGVALFQTERQKEIHSLTLQHGRVEVAELAERFSVTTETIRRDLSDLQRQRTVRRVHGGAVPWETAGFEPLVSIRSDQHDSEKRRLAQAAVAELPDTGSIIIDSGSTLTRFAEAIPSSCSLRIVTNSLATAQVLSEYKHVDVIVLGGKVRKTHLGHGRRRRRGRRRTVEGRHPVHQQRCRLARCWADNPLPGRVRPKASHDRVGPTCRLPWSTTRSSRPTTSCDSPSGPTLMCW